MKYFIKENDYLKNAGWGNGYVVIPKGHPLHGKSYDEIQELVNLDIHGGLTFSESAKDLNWKELPENTEDGWVVGFDTCHLFDTFKWPRHKVLAETLNLKKQLLEYK